MKSAVDYEDVQKDVLLNIKYVSACKPMVLNNFTLQKYLLEQRAVVDVDGGKLLNEDNDLRSVSKHVFLFNYHIAICLPEHIV